MRAARSAGECSRCAGLCVDWMRTLHPRDPARRTRARRALVVGTRRYQGVRAAHGPRRTADQDQGGMSPIAALPNLPLFHKLKGRKTVVVGASAAADWKAQLLAAAGANVLRLDDSWGADQFAGAAIVCLRGVSFRSQWVFLSSRSQTVDTSHEIRFIRPTRLPPIGRVCCHRRRRWAFWSCWGSRSQAGWHGSQSCHRAQ